MNLKEDKDKILEMLISEDSELRKLAVNYIRNNYNIDIIVPFFAGLGSNCDLDKFNTAEWQLNLIRVGYDDEFMIENLINAIIEHNKL